MDRVLIAQFKICRKTRFYSGFGIVQSNDIEAQSVAGGFAGRFVGGVDEGNQSRNISIVQGN